ncbi:MAG: hypothetical protein ACFFCS_06700 [Candidatus Hodarchaeota archaeon]
MFRVLYRKLSRVIADRMKRNLGKATKMLNRTLHGLIMLAGFSMMLMLFGGLVMVMRIYLAIDTTFLFLYFVTLPAVDAIQDDDTLEKDARQDFVIQNKFFLGMFYCFGAVILATVAMYLWLPFNLEALSII